MTIEARTYYTIPGYFKIVDPFLINCTILDCERDGIQFDASSTVPSAGERKYNHTSGSGTISFGIANPFNVNEKVYVLIKY